MSLFGHRFVCFTAIIRVNQIEVRRDESIGADERTLNTPERVQALREAFRAGCPNGRMTWALSWHALFDSSDNYRQIHRLMREYHDTYGDEITFIPGGYFANVYNTRAEINRDLSDALSRITEIMGNSYRPRAIAAGMLPAACQQYLAEREGIHVVQGQIFSQYAIDNGSCDGSICYPYYTSTEHMLKPAQGAKDFIDCVNLDGWTVDFLAARFAGFECGNSRAGVGPIESIGAFGMDGGVKLMLATTAVHFDAGFELNRFGYVCVSWEVSLDTEWNAGLTQWLRAVNARWLETRAVTVGEFGEEWRAAYSDNTKLDYRFTACGTGIAKGSEENLKIDWYMNQGFRLALLSDLTSKAQPLVIDYTRYDVNAIEPQTVGVPDWSLMNVLNMKKTRPQDVPREFSELPAEERTKILSRYPDLISIAP